MNIDSALYRKAKALPAHVFHKIGDKTVVFIYGSIDKLDLNYGGAFEHELFNITQHGDNYNSLFVIEVKTRYMKVVENGIIVFNKQRMTAEDVGHGQPLIAYQEFMVLVSSNLNAAVFSRNVTTTQKA